MIGCTVLIILEKGWPGEVPGLKIECECAKPGLLLLRSGMISMIHL